VEIQNRKDFLKRSKETLEEILEMLEKLPSLHLENFNTGSTAFVMVDMLNGFAREGALKSPRVERLIPTIKGLLQKCEDRNIKKLAFADSHTKESPEFLAYPPHCMEGTYESEVVDEIKELGGYTLIPKNSTNGFLEEGFQNWLKENPDIKTFIVTGDCTDICILQFSVTLKTWFNIKNENARIIVPMNGVDTYDLGTHNGDLMHVMALYNMIQNGVEVVREVF
jgi:nicotinamidase-related amidase